ncbi:MAG: glycosyltransferase, partial [Clostridia bacterium]|nr:glycosyltransferase [Clostridia bacterium]
LALRAAAILRDRGFDFRWYFVGDGDDRAKLEKMIDTLSLCDKIIIMGYLMNPYPYIGSCDIYVQPSYEESFGLAVMEARILGRAIVSTDTVGCRIVLETGRNGIITPITAEGLADGIAELLTDEQKRKSFENKYPAEDNLREKAVYADSWDILLSG